MILDNFRVENIPHTMSCQQMSYENKHKYLFDATFLKASAAHTVHKEILSTFHDVLTLRSLL